MVTVRWSPLTKLNTQTFNTSNYITPPIESESFLFTRNLTWLTRLWPRPSLSTSTIILRPLDVFRSPTVLEGRSVNYTWSRRMTLKVPASLSDLKISLSQQKCKNENIPILNGFIQTTKNIIYGFLGEGQERCRFDESYRRTTTTGLSSESPQLNGRSDQTEKSRKSVWDLIVWHTRTQEDWIGVLPFRGRGWLNSHFYHQSLLEKCRLIVNLYNVWIADVGLNDPSFRLGDL